MLWFFLTFLWWQVLLCLAVLALLTIASHKSHLSLIPSWTDEIWVCSWSLEPTALSQVGQTNAFSWALLICWFKWLFWPKAMSHWVHLKGLSPRWPFMCTFNWEGQPNDFSHWSQGCAFFGPFLAAWGFLALGANFTCLAFGSPFPKNKIDF